MKKSLAVESVWLKTIDKAVQDDADEIAAKMRERNATVWPDTLWLSAASLIERQAAEIEKWKKELVAAQAEIERLRSACEAQDAYAEQQVNARIEAQAEIGTLKEEKAVAWLRYGDAQAEVERLRSELNGRLGQPSGDPAKP